MGKGISTMCEMKNLDSAITLLYELVTDQLANPGKLDEMLQRASDLYKEAVSRQDTAVECLRSLVQSDVGDEVIEELIDRCDEVGRLLFQQAYLLGYSRILI